MGRGQKQEGAGCVTSHVCCSLAHALVSYVKFQVTDRRSRRNCCFSKFEGLCERLALPVANSHPRVGLPLGEGRGGEEGRGGGSNGSGE